MRREDLDTRVRDVIVESISQVHISDGGYCGDWAYDFSLNILRDLRNNGFDVVTVGQDVTTGVPNDLKLLVTRFQRPRYQDYTTYCRGFAERVIDAIYDAGMEIRT